MSQCVFLLCCSCNLQLSSFLVYNKKTYPISGIRGCSSVRRWRITKEILATCCHVKAHQKSPSQVTTTNCLASGFPASHQPQFLVSVTPPHFTSFQNVLFNLQVAWEGFWFKVNLDNCGLVGIHVTDQLLLSYFGGRLSIWASVLVALGLFRSF